MVHGVLRERASLRVDASRPQRAATPVERTVALSEGTIAILREHLARQRRDRLAGGEAWHDTGLVLTYEDARMVRPDNVTHLFRRLAKEAGLPLIRLHTLRPASQCRSSARGLGTPASRSRRSLHGRRARGRPMQSSRSRPSSRCAHDEGRPAGGGEAVLAPC